VTNSVTIRDLHVLSVPQEVRNYSVTHRQRLNDHPNSLAKSLFQRPNYNRRLMRYYPADLATRFNWYSATPPQSTPNYLWLNLNMRCITGCISYIPLIVNVSMVAECLRKDCNILGDKIEKNTYVFSALKDINHSKNDVIRCKEISIPWVPYLISYRHSIVKPTHAHFQFLLIKTYLNIS